MYRLWVYTDEEGTIQNTYGGHEQFIVSPEYDYDYYFEVDEDVYKNIGLYRVVDGTLQKR